MCSEFGVQRAAAAILDHPANLGHPVAMYAKLGYPILQSAIL